MYNDDAQWLSQNIFTHRDTIYGTNGYMRVSISTKTKDSLSFSAPLFVININNDGIRKSATLSYQKLFDIRNRLKEVVSAAMQEYNSKEASPDAQLHHKVGKSNFLTFEFLRGNQSEPVVRISISHGTSDSTKVILPFSDFIAFSKLIGDFVGDQRQYMDWCLHFPNRFFLAEMNEIAKQIPGLVKSAVVQIDRETPPAAPEIQSHEPTVDEGNIQEASETMQDLNSFMGSDMENIELDMPDIPIENKKEVAPKDPTDNKLFKWLDGDIKNYETILMRCAEKSNPIREMETELNDNYAEMDCFPGITEKEMKSMVYLIGREYFIYNEQANKGAIKRSFSINKYRGDKHAKPINTEVAFDLLLLHIIIKICREKIENKTPDNYTNKTLLHLASSLNVSPFIFSFISKGTELGPIIIKKFLEIKELGMLKSYEENEFKNYDFEITDRDIRDIITNLEEYFKSDAYHSESSMRHVALFSNKSCLLNPDNRINEEQIINQVVPFEMYILMQGKDPVKDKTDLLEYAKEQQYDSDVVSLFVKASPKKMIPIVKFFEDHGDEIPEECRLDFMEQLEEFNGKDYDLSDAKFPYDSFGEEGIKALYLWKPETGEKFTTYKKFQKAVINSTHDKNTILSMITHETEDVKGETFADFYGKG